MQQVGQAGTDQSAAVEIEPEFVEGGGSAGGSLDSGYYCGLLAGVAGGGRLVGSWLAGG